MCYKMLFTTLHGHPSLQACELGTSIALSFGWETQAQEGHMTFSQPVGRARGSPVALLSQTFSTLSLCPAPR